MCVLIILAEDVQRFGGVSRVTTPTTTTQNKIGSAGIWRYPRVVTPSAAGQSRDNPALEKAQDLTREKDGDFYNGS